MSQSQPSKPQTAAKSESTEKLKPTTDRDTRSTYSLYQDLSRDTAEIAKSLGFAPPQTVKNIQ